MGGGGGRPSTLELAALGCISVIRIYGYSRFCVWSLGCRSHALESLRVLHRVLKGEGFKGGMQPKVPYYSPRLPKAPSASLRFPRYLAPMNPLPRRPYNNSKSPEAFASVSLHMAFSAVLRAVGNRIQPSRSEKDPKEL